MPKALMLAKLGNSDAALTQAIKDGDVYIVREKGRDFYAFKTLEVTRSTGVKSSTTVKDSEVELSEKNQEAMGSFFHGFENALGLQASSSAPSLTVGSLTGQHFLLSSFQ